ncbi:hypothetical protein HPB51_010378 [Rhipicephalus microplus]|uniref:Uncharacterized protein n=1 Tax=Rhipicephalus microplus TaxID=6941 RepID=A0A9J6EGA9_RHIMP|nr:hypothetical protein HPB51_010378 [Rhipicephalus microplus]
MPPPAKQCSARFYFTHEVDIFLLREVLAVDPFGDGFRGAAIARNLSAVLLRNVVAQSLRDHLDLLLAQFAAAVPTTQRSHELSREQTTLITKSLICTRKRTSIMEGGKIVIPGASSPPRKSTTSNSEDSSSARRKALGTAKGRQQTIHQQLAVTTVIACTLSSAMSLRRNRANAYFLDYFRDDQELKKSTQCNIRLYLQKKRHGMGRIGNPISVLCMVIAYAIPMAKWVHGVSVDFDGIVRRLPWGAIITIAGSDTIMLIIKVRVHEACF